MNPSEDDWKKTVKLVEQFYNRADCEPFREPVAFVELGLSDYPRIIKTPMDLGTIKKQLTGRTNQYNTLYQVGEDVNLVWSNCKVYNADGSDFYKLADELEKKWNQKFAKLLADCGAGKPGASEKLSLADKKTFAQSLFQISKEDLGKILVEVTQKCPAAITRNAEEDECELNIDKLPAELIQELATMTSGDKKKKARTK